MCQLKESVYGNYFEINDAVFCAFSREKHLVLDWRYHFNSKAACFKVSFVLLNFDISCCMFFYIHVPPFFIDSCTEWHIWNQLLFNVWNVLYHFRAYELNKWTKPNKLWVDTIWTSQPLREEVSIEEKFFIYTTSKNF